jgi:hypothetical protein
MKFKVIYLEPASGNAPLGFDITELELERLPIADEVIE